MKIKTLSHKFTNLNWNNMKTEMYNKIKKHIMYKYIINI